MGLKYLFLHLLGKNKKHFQKKNKSSRNGSNVFINSLNRWRNNALFLEKFWTPTQIFLNIKNFIFSNTLQIMWMFIGWIKIQTKTKKKKVQSVPWKSRIRGKGKKPSLPVWSPPPHVFICHAEINKRTKTFFLPQCCLWLRKQ